MEGHDIFVSLPTGSGKSLCYWSLPGAFDYMKDNHHASSIVIVVSPLTALMKDQVKSLCKKGVKAIHVDAPNDNVLKEIHQGVYQLLFFGPEELLGNLEWRDMLLSTVYTSNLVGFIIDEAHCVKKWGKQFRKEFGHLGEVRSLLPEGTKVMALTATATRSSRREICRILGLTQPVIVASLPDRRNIVYKVHKIPGIIEETFAPLVEEVKRCRTGMDRVIIFCRSYDNAGYIYAYLTNRLGKEVLEPIGAPNLSVYRLVDMFTACTPKKVKDSIIANFTAVNSPLRVVVATIAFGMGLDCPDVSKIIHWGPPGDIESYLQETGRAGRDNLPSDAVLYVSK